MRWPSSRSICGVSNSRLNGWFLSFILASLIVSNEMSFGGCVAAGLPVVVLVCTAAGRARWKPQPLVSSSTASPQACGRRCEPRMLAVWRSSHFRPIQEVKHLFAAPGPAPAGRPENVPATRATCLVYIAVGRSPELTRRSGRCIFGLPPRAQQVPASRTSRNLRIPAVSLPAYTKPLIYTFLPIKSNAERGSTAALRIGLLSRHRKYIGSLAGSGSLLGNKPLPARAGSSRPTAPRPSKRAQARQFMAAGSTAAPPSARTPDRPAARPPTNSRPAATSDISPSTSATTGARAEGLRYWTSDSSSCCVEYSGSTTCIRSQCSELRDTNGRDENFIPSSA